MGFLQKFSKNSEETNNASTEKVAAKTTHQKDASVHFLMRETGKPWQSLLRPGFSTKKVTRLDRWLVKKVFSVLGFPAYSIRLWNGEEMAGSDRPSRTLMTLHDRGALIKLCINPELYFGDLYSCGRIDFDGSIVACIEETNYGLRKVKVGMLRGLIIKFGIRKLMNTLANSRDNIHHHYDISNDFYNLWLDKEVQQYTCAYFPEVAMTLEQAQIAKLHHICQKLQLKPGEIVVEAGCGWGGLARFMAKHYAVKVTAYNISHQQILFARERAKAEGLSELVDYVEDDYRNISGQFDVFVSVGMLEHVGTHYFTELGKVISACLKPNGRGLIHSIGQNFSEPMNAWIEKRIFPGAYPPTIKEMMAIFEPNKLSVQDIENLRMHYAKTLEHWILRFEQHAEEITEMLDEEFVRAWRLYLSGSIAGFTTGELQLFQILFNQADSNQLPWSRAYMYQAHD